MSIFTGDILEQMLGAGDCMCDASVCRCLEGGRSISMNEMEEMEGGQLGALLGLALPSLITAVPALVKAIKGGALIGSATPVGGACIGGALPKAVNDFLKKARKSPKLKKQVMSCLAKAGKSKAKRKSCFRKREKSAVRQLSKNKALVNLLGKSSKLKKEAMMMMTPKRARKSGAPSLAQLKARKEGSARLKKINELARRLKAKDASLGHRDAISLASKMLVKEGQI